MDKFMTIKNAKEFANIANYIKAHGTVTTDCYDECTSYTYNDFEYTIWDDGIKEIVIDGMVTTLYPDGSTRCWKW
jgi:hypothetical protein